MTKRLSSIWDYSQPDFYHFSEDSIRLAELVVNSIDQNGAHLKALDLCAGCGVIGIEIMNARKNISFDFCELQKEFKPHLEKNLTSINFNGKILISDYQDLVGKYDLIVCNPPYFDPNKSRMSSDRNKRLCRSFIQGSLESLILKMNLLLASHGRGYFLSRDTPPGMKPIMKISETYLFELD